MAFIKNYDIPSFNPIGFIDTFSKNNESIIPLSLSLKLFTKFEGYEEQSKIIAEYLLGDDLMSEACFTKPLRIRENFPLESLFSTRDYIGFPYKAIWNFTNFNQSLANCKKTGKRFIIIPLNLKSIDRDENKAKLDGYFSDVQGYIRDSENNYVETNINAHRNIIIIDNENKTIENFEPYGYSRPGSKDIDKQIKYLFDNKFNPQVKFIDITGFPPYEGSVNIDFSGYTFRTIEEICPEKSLQAVQEENTTGIAMDPVGYCVGYSWLYAQLRIRFPNIGPREIQDQIYIAVNKNPKLLLNFIRNYTYYMLYRTPESIVMIENSYKDSIEKLMLTNMIEGTDPISSELLFDYTKMSIEELSSGLFYIFVKSYCNANLRIKKWIPRTKNEDINILDFLGLLSSSDIEESKENLKKSSRFTMEDYISFLDDLFPADTFTLKNYILLDYTDRNIKSYLEQDNIFDETLLPKYAIGLAFFFNVIYSSVLKDNQCTIIGFERPGYEGRTIEKCKKNYGHRFILTKIRNRVTGKSELYFLNFLSGSVESKMIIDSSENISLKTLDNIVKIFYDECYSIITYIAVDSIIINDLDIMMKDYIHYF